MMLALVRVALTFAAGFGLWRLWRRMAPVDPRAAKIIGAGFLIRALGGQALFWISWLKLPIARSLQLGDGIWFYAIDGAVYLAGAERVLRDGPLAILSVTAVYPSHVFVQIVALSAALFGSVAALAILLNCAAYLGTSAVVVSMAGRERRMSTAGLFALAAISFGPGAVLWSLQLLKDTVLVFLATAIVGGYASWQRFWRSDRGATPSAARLLAIVIAMAACFFGLAGVRWYFALMILAASVPFGAIVAWKSGRRLPAIATFAVLLILFSQAVRLGGGTDVPVPIREVLAFDPAVLVEWQPGRVAATLAQTRGGFETTQAPTNIEPGPALLASAPSASGAPDDTRPSEMSAGPESTSPNAPAEMTATAPSIEPGSKAPMTPQELLEDRISRARERDGSPSEPPTDATLWPPGVVADLSARLAMFVLPRVITQAVGIAQAGGGRGLWMFAEVDTVAFDLVLLASIALSWQRLRSPRAAVTPLFVLLVLTLVLLLPPMLYTVNNFGTLFRMRLMVYLLAALVPLTLTGQRPLSPPAVDRV